MRVKLVAGMVGLAMLGGAQAWAADDEASRDGVVWRCWWDQGSHVSCTVEQVPQVWSVESPAALLPGIAGMVRARPQAFSNRLVHIPLHTPHPFQTDGMSTLAQAVMCGARRDCRVRFSADLPQAAELERLSDPVLASDG
jgi:hypothetical protein